MDQIMSLNGKWELSFHLEDGKMPENPAELHAAGWPKIEAAVPGNVELDLVRAGLAPDPLVGMNLYEFRKYEFYQWWYERDFAVPAEFAGKRLILRLNGLDTYGTVWLNGALAGETDNMLIEHELDVTDKIRCGETNRITIRIASAVNKVRSEEYPANVLGAEHHDELVWIRKPPASFGWDIAPRLLSAGIWRDIELVARENTRLTEVYYATLNASRESADLAVRFRFVTDRAQLDGFSVRVTGTCGTHRFYAEKNVNFISDGFVIKVENPQLWWPKGYGTPHLYETTFELLLDGRVVDRRTERIGIRKLEIDAVYEEGGRGEFRIMANGVPVLAKGSNWVPLSALHSLDRDRLQQAHDLLEDLGCNIVRCWGGNVYEDHKFFDLCDERGIMVWQDFAMACAIYPQQERFYEKIRKEAASVIRKLRNHPSLLLWAGDNEIDQKYYHEGYRLPHARYNRISREILANMAPSHDPFRAYLPSSPYIPEHMEGDLSVPEQHNWGPRDYYKGDFYKNSTAHFISEIGYHGCPAVSSLKKFISPENLWPYNNDEWDTHNTDYLPLGRRKYNRNELMANQVEIMFGRIPESLEEFVLASQISQAEAKKFFVEMVRLKKWRRTGVIWWNVLDCWPQISDAVVDYYWTKKIAYYYLKRVHVPVCLMMDEIENWHHKVVLGNDSLQSGTVEYRVEDGDSGETLAEGTADIQPNENRTVALIRAKEGQKKLYILRWKFQGKEYGNHYISGLVPFDLEQYKQWLKIIEQLPMPFDSKQCCM